MLSENLSPDIFNLNLFIFLNASIIKVYLISHWICNNQIPKRLFSSVYQNFHQYFEFNLLQFSLFFNE